MSKSRFTAGRFVRGKSLPAGFALCSGASRPVLHDDPDPDTDLPSDRIEPDAPRVPTPSDQFVDVLAVSILERMAETHAKLAEDCRKLAAELAPRDVVA